MLPAQIVVTQSLKLVQIDAIQEVTHGHRSCKFRACDRSASAAFPATMRPLVDRDGTGHFAASSDPATDDPVMRWMEALLERANGDAGRLAPSPWTDSREDSPDRAPSAEPPVGVEWPTRTLNFLLAFLAIVSLLPVFLLLAVLIKLTSRGPVFYLQERVGLDRRLPDAGPVNHRRTHDFGGRVFTIYKFRTMRVDAEAAGAAVWAQEQDPRVTPLGRVLRQYRLDELPQL